MRASATPFQNKMSNLLRQRRYDIARAVAAGAAAVPSTNEQPPPMLFSNKISCYANADTTLPEQLQPEQRPISSTYEQPLPSAAPNQAEVAVGSTDKGGAADQTVGEGVAATTVSHAEGMPGTACAPAFFPAHLAHLGAGPAAVDEDDDYDS